MAVNRSLAGKLAIVTGGSRGIGAAICENLASKGCNLIMNYTSTSSEGPCNALADNLSKAHDIKALPVRADLSSPDGPAALVKAARDSYGPDVLVHILVNNAGVAGNRPLDGATPEQFTADFQRQYTTNVLGPLLLTQALTPHLPTDRTGRVVNVSSVSAALGFEGQSVYGGTKAALEAMTRTWARELRFRATVNSVNPGPVATDMYGGTSPGFQRHVRPFLENAPGAQVREGLDDPELIKEVTEGGSDGRGIGGRAATAKEIAGVVGMLCGEEASWCTGCVICANGGMIMGL